MRPRTDDEPERALHGEVPYDELSGLAQAPARAGWDAAIAERVAALNFEERLNKSGVPWAEADGDGNVVVHNPT